MAIAVSAELAAAIEAAERHPLMRVQVDWDGDGFGGGIDDLSNRTGAFTVDRSLTTDTPDPVRIIDGTAAATVSVTLTEGDPSDETMHPARYFTRGSDSPLGSRERNQRPLTVDIGFITSAGPQYVRRLTGFTRRMLTQSAGRTATLAGIDNRAKLRNAVTLVPVNGTLAGLDGTFLVTQALAANGIGAGPLPRATGSILWCPMYGSIRQIRPYATEFDASALFAVPGSAFGDRATFVAGPFVLAASPHYTSSTDYRRLVVVAPPTALTTPYLGTSGRLEMWVQGVAAPGGPGGTIPLRVALWYGNFAVSIAAVYLGVNTSGQPSLIIYTAAGVVAHTYVSAQTIPADGAWHFVGIHFDHLANTVTFRVDNSTDTLTTTTLPTEIPVAPLDTMQFYSYAPVSDVHFHDIPAATPWLADTVNIGAVIDPSLLALNACYESDPRDAFDLLTELAKAEQASAAFDEFGVFRYRTRARLTGVAGQTVSRVITTTNGALLDAAVDDGMDQIRNVVQVGYTTVAVTPPSIFTPSSQVFAYEDGVRRVVGGGTSLDISIAFDKPVLAMPWFVEMWSVGEFATVPVVRGAAYIIVTTKNDYSDDGGSSSPIYTLPVLTAKVVSWSPTGCVVRVTNPKVSALYIAALGVQGTCALLGGATVAEARDATSIARFGPQSMHLDTNQWVQSAGAALSLASALVGDLKDPHPQVTSLRIVGDPRRQIGDRVEIADPTGLRLDGEFWLTQVTDTVDDNGGYEQTIAARAATTVLRWGVGRWGVDTWG